MKAQETTIEELVNGNRQFRVPLYQRTYSWQEKQWAQLWSAIREQAEALTDSDPGPAHFLGPVVLAPGPTLPSGPQRWIVVDGQQRLTTLSLLLCALRDRARLEDAKLADKIHEDYLTNRWEVGDDALRLLPTQADRAAFQACVAGAVDAGAAGAIGEAYRYFQRMLAEFDDPDDPGDLRRLERAIARRLEIVWIAADKDDNVYRIFESLNNTGLKLTQADLLRNYLFMLLPQRGEAVYRDLWQPTHELLGTEGLELLAWLDLVLRGQQKVRRDDVYRNQRHRLAHLEKQLDEVAVEAEVAELTRRGRLLSLLLDPDREAHQNVRRALRRLTAWDAVTIYPAAMAILDRRDKTTATSEEVADALTCLESFLVRRMLCGTPTNNLNRILNSAPAELVDGPIVEKIREYLSRERHYWADDAALRDAIRDRNFYWSGRSQQRQFVLRRFEESFEHKEPVDWTRASLTVEHVMPQTLNAAWRRDLEPLAPAGQTVRDAHAALVHTLGNLTLSGYNGQLSNKPFADKRILLRDSGLAMNHAVAASRNWGPEQILDRADELAGRAIALWPGPNPRPAEPPAEKPKWRTLRQALTALPAGTWTSPADLAELVSSYQGVVTRHLRSNAFPNIWRVLDQGGSVLPDLRWPDGAEREDPLARLTAEGVDLIEGVASQYHRMWPTELAQLIGLTSPEAVSAPPPDPDSEAEFWGVFDAEADAATIAGLRAAVEAWRQAGGEFSVGYHEEISGYFAVGTDRSAVPWIVSPENDYVEMAFDALRLVPPFDDPAVREEFRKRCEVIPGIVVPAAKVDFQPWFPLDVLANPEAREPVRDALQWFASACTADEMPPG
ncbi:DUF262 domain-containing protein [Dactylosporangium sp. CA-152071]|uniref:DUF262 domain-containing protein n=1 Tax=Dactylosporangium sp. CA-152071 TaxID=3239933 RepID=UPI003D927255